MRTRKYVHMITVCGDFTPEVIPQFFTGSWQPPFEDLVGTQFNYLLCSGAGVSDESISLPLEDFLKAHAVCPGCGSQAAAFLDDNHCPCGTDFGPHGDFALLILGEEEDRTFKFLLERSRKGEVAKRRYNHKGQLPKGLLDALLQVQESRCYYCVTPVERIPDPVDHQAHIDHLDPFETSYLFNLVCSCRRCNLKKGRTDADSFAKSMAGTLLSEELSERKTLWTRLKRWRHTKAGKLWENRLENLCQ